MPGAASPFLVGFESTSTGIGTMASAATTSSGVAYLQKGKDDRK
jgi:hypothetical protein